MASHRSARTAHRPGIRELQFYISASREINKLYAGKHIAVIGERVTASGKSPMAVWKRAKKLHPHRTPVLAFVPRSDTVYYGSKRGTKLSDFAGSKTISKEDWQKAHVVIRNAEAETRRRLQKNLF